MTEQPVTLRASSHDDPAVCHLDGAIWWPAIAQLPKLRYDLFSGSFDGQIDTPSSTIALMTEAFPDLPRFALADARFRLWRGEVGAAWADYVLRFDGIVTGQPKVEALTATVDFAVDDRWLDTPVLDLYAGTTGIEGEAGQKGSPKPWSLGRPRYVPGTMIDSVDGIVQLSAYGAIQSLDGALERLVRFPFSIGDYANLAALKAAAIPRGYIATCKALGLVRHGAPLEGMPSYLVSGDAAGPDGWARKPGEIIRRIAHKLGKLDRVSGASLDALDAACPWNLSLYLGEQVTARAIIQRIAASVNAVAGVSWLGQLFVVPIALGEPVMNLRSDGSALPMVGDVRQIDVSPPYWRMAVQAERTWQVHALSDIAFSAALLDRGRYIAAESYREGDVVDMPDGSRWLHVGTTPTVGVAPGTNAAIWFNLSASIDPADIRYDGGAGPTLQDLKPAEPGATAGAPAGTYVADKLAEEVVADALATVGIVEEQRAQLSKLLTNYLKTMLLAETREQRSQALAWLDGEHLHTVQRRETQARIDGDTAIVTDLALLGAKSLDGSAWILDIDTVKVSPTQTYAERDAEISASLTTLDGEIAANVTSLETAIADEAAARATAIDTVTAALATETSNREAAITSVQDAVSDEAGARATAISDLQSQVDGVEADLAAQVSTLEEAISDESSARASALLTVNATLDSHDATITANSASISSLSTAQSSLSTTVANNYSYLNAYIGGVGSTVTIHSGAISTLEGRTKGFWSITANAGSGATAFISAQAETSPGVTTSNVAFGAREVHISNPVGGAWTKVLSISGGNVQIYGNLTATGSVTTPNLVSNSVTKAGAALSTSNVTGTGSYVGIGAEATLVLDYAADVICIYVGFLNYTSGVPSTAIRFIRYNSSHSAVETRTGPSSGAGAYMPCAVFATVFASLSAGTHYIEPQFNGGTNGVYINSGSGVVYLISKR
ncbi:DUF1983 domain-containing protein [Rhizorhabdus histidinilytica]|uniref:DUF1983 domain-containing protein n=1 Tax=Rhizorhabdus histidinilytica TaxID=439228 RepID=UPI00321FCA8D